MSPLSRVKLVLLLLVLDIVLEFALVADVLTVEQGHVRPYKGCKASIHEHLNKLS